MEVVLGVHFYFSNTTHAQARLLFFFSSSFDTEVVKYASTPSNSLVSVSLISTNPPLVKVLTRLSCFAATHFCEHAKQGRRELGWAPGQLVGAGPFLDTGTKGAQLGTFCEFHNMKMVHLLVEF